MFKRQLILAVVVAMAVNVGCDDGDEPADDQPAEVQQHADEEQPVDDETGGDPAAVDPAAMPTLQTYGELRNINMRNDYSPSVGLAEGLNGQEPINHAVGALGDLTGEITVIDDTVYLGHADDEPHFEQVPVAKLDDDLDATILFGAATDGWADVDLGDARDLESLQKRLEQWRDEHNIDAPLSFRITDPRPYVEWHVVDGERLPEEGANSCDERKEYAHQYETDGQPVTIAGLFTTDHTAVVVDHTTSIHAHVVDDEGRSGHVDAVELSDDAGLTVAIR